MGPNPIGPIPPPPESEQRHLRRILMLISQWFSDIKQIEFLKSRIIDDTLVDADCLCPLFLSKLAMKYITFYFVRFFFFNEERQNSLQMCLSKTIQAFV